MLVLTRKTDESIIIDNQIEITVLGIEDGKVKLGISAPKNISVYRKEVYQEIENENKQAAIGSLKLGDIGKLLKKE